jgi:hypothetical protein
VRELLFGDSSAALSERHRRSSNAQPVASPGSPMRATSGIEVPTPYREREGRGCRPCDSLLPQSGLARMGSLLRLLQRVESQFSPNWRLYCRAAYGPCENVTTSTARAPPQRLERAAACRPRRAHRLDAVPVLIVPGPSLTTHSRTALRVASFKRHSRTLAYAEVLQPRLAGYRSPSQAR